MYFKGIKDIREETHTHLQHPYKQDADLSHFYVVTVISNPARFKRRYELYWKFAKLCESAHVHLITVEQALGERPFAVTQANNPYHVQVRSAEELWLKENMINIGIRRACALDPKAREIAWIDADCFPMIPARKWFEETWHALQTYEVVQMWEYLINFGPQNQPLGRPDMSFMATYAAADYQVVKGKNVKHTLAGHSGLVSLGRSGLAWAANVSALNAVGGLIDYCILGSADWHMAHALVGGMSEHSKEVVLSQYAKALWQWQEKCERWIKRDVGFVPVTLGHWFHGNKVDRKYPTRGKILIDNNYNPYTDIKYDCQGLLQLETHEPRQIRLRDQIRAYFRSRNEDHNML